MKEMTDIEKLDFALGELYMAKIYLEEKMRVAEIYIKECKSKLLNKGDEKI